VEYEPDPAELPPDFMLMAKEWCQPAEVPVGTVRLWKGAGCRACRNTGYKGRAGIFELMLTTEAIREMCVQRVNANAIRTQAIKEGMITLRQDGWRKVLAGVTTIEEVARVTAGDIVA
jgi:general secretion pathway protein E/type IV pilus assembly protein PilB